MMWSLEIPVYRQSVGSTGDNLDLQLASEMAEYRKPQVVQCNYKKNIRLGEKLVRFEETAFQN